MVNSNNTCELFQVWQMAENIYNDEEPDTPAADIDWAAAATTRSTWIPSKQTINVFPESLSFYLIFL